MDFVTAVRKLMEHVCNCPLLMRKGM